MLNVDDAKLVIWKLADEINEELGGVYVQPHQQEVTKKHKLN